MTIKETGTVTVDHGTVTLRVPGNIPKAFVDHMTVTELILADPQARVIYDDLGRYFEERNEKVKEEVAFTVQRYTDA